MCVTIVEMCGEQLKRHSDLSDGVQFVVVFMGYYNYEMVESNLMQFYCKYK